MRKVLWMMVVALCLPVFIGYAEDSILPLGTYEYKVMVNEKEVGSATMKFEQSKGTYIADTKIEMSVSNGPNILKIIQSLKTVETTEFVPVSYAASIVQSMGGQKQEMKIEATVKDKKININRDGNHTSVDMPAGVMFSSSLKATSDVIKKKFAAGAKLTYKMIEPAMGDTVEDVTVAVVGKEETDVNGKKMKLNKVTQTWKAMTITVFCDDKGVVYVMETQQGPVAMKMVKK